MKVGSIVECVPAPPGSKNSSDLIAAIKAAGYKWPTIGQLYVIRELTGIVSGGIAVYLEEIVNPRINTTVGYVELPFNIKLFREILPPQDLTELLEECSHLQLQNI